MLLNSSWDVSEIGYCLGFVYAPNFNILSQKANRGKDKVIVITGASGGMNVTTARKLIELLWNNAGTTFHVKASWKNCALILDDS